MIKRFKNLLVFALLLAGSVTVSAQSTSGVEKFPLKEGILNGLQKVKIGPYYGVWDANDNVVVSVEYAEFVFVDDIAILTKSDGTVHGYIRDDGEVLMFDDVYEYHPRFSFYWNGFLPVRQISKVKIMGEDTEGKWIFLDESGNPIFNPMFNKKKIKMRLPYKFYKVNTFSDGYAVVTTNKNELIHIDKKGNRSFTLPKGETCYFRSSVNKGECIIITDKGVQVCQEDPHTKEARVKMPLTYYIAKLNTSTLPDSLSFDGGTLHFDLWGRATKFVPASGDVMYFMDYIRDLENKINNDVKEGEDGSNPDEFFSLDSLTVKMRYTVAEASVNGYATYAASVVNESKVLSDTLKVTVKSSGMRDKVETFILTSGEGKRITFSIPARFAEEQQKRNVTVIITAKEAIREEQFVVIAKRWHGDEDDDL